LLTEYLLAGVLEYAGVLIIKNVGPAQIARLNILPTLGNLLGTVMNDFIAVNNPVVPEFFSQFLDHIWRLCLDEAHLPVRPHEIERTGCAIYSLFKGRASPSSSKVNPNS
jgi:hypothetical protein